MSTLRGLLTPPLLTSCDNCTEFQSEGGPFDPCNPGGWWAFLPACLLDFPIILGGLFPKCNKNSVNSENSWTLINHWSMNWSQFKDPISHPFLVAAMITSWSLTQEVAGSNLFDNKYFSHWIRRIQRKHLGKIQMILASFCIESDKEIQTKDHNLKWCNIYWNKCEAWRIMLQVLQKFSPFYYTLYDIFGCSSIRFHFHKLLLTFQWAIISWDSPYSQFSAGNFLWIYRFITASKRSLGQGYIFTGVCHSVNREVPAPSWGVWSWGVLQAHTQGGNWRGSDPGPHPRGKLRGIRPPPPTTTAAGGTHPTGMHSCFILCVDNQLIPRKLQMFSQVTNYGGQWNLLAYCSDTFESHFWLWVPITKWRR